MLIFGRSAQSLEEPATGTGAASATDRAQVRGRTSAPAVSHGHHSARDRVGQRTQRVVYASLILLAQPMSNATSHRLAGIRLGSSIDLTWENRDQIRPGGTGPLS